MPIDLCAWRWSHVQVPGLILSEMRGDVLLYCSVGGAEFEVQTLGYSGLKLTKGVGIVFNFEDYRFFISILSDGQFNGNNAPDGNCSLCIKRSCLSQEIEPVSKREVFFTSAILSKAPKLLWILGLIASVDLH